VIVNAADTVVELYVLIHLDENCMNCWKSQFNLIKTI